MFEYQVANDKVRTLSSARPRFGKISEGKRNMIEGHFGFGLFEHADGQIESADSLSDFSQLRCVLARTAANLEDGVAALLGQGFAGDDLIEIASKIAI